MAVSKQGSRVSWAPWKGSHGMSGHAAARPVCKRTASPFAFSFCPAFVQPAHSRHPAQPTSRLLPADSQPRLYRRLYRPARGRWSGTPPAAYVPAIVPPGHVLAIVPTGARPIVEGQQEDIVPARLNPGFRQTETQGSGTPNTGVSVRRNRASRGRPHRPKTEKVLAIFLVGQIPKR